MFDGSSCEFQSCVGVMLVSAERYESEHALRFTSKASNNQNEYETIITYLKLARKLSSHRYLLSDFPLVVNQINAELEKKEEQLIKYLEMTKLIIMALEIVRVKRVQRENNKRTDVITTLISSIILELGNMIYVNLLQIPNMEEPNNYCVNHFISWMTPIF